MSVLLRQVITLVISVVLAWVFGGLAFLVQGAPVTDAFFVEAPSLVFVFMDIGLVVWMVLLIIGGIRRQGLGAGKAGTIIAAVVAALANLAVIAVLVMQSGTADMLAISLGVQAGAVFVAGAGVATVLAHRLVPVPARAAGPAPVNPPDATSE
jgi:hypothetical protein